MTLRGAMLRFGCVGAVNTAVNYGTFAVLVAGAVHYVEAAVIGFFAGVATSYVLNRRWTFGCRTAPSAPEAARFLLVNVTTLGVYTAVTAWCGEVLHHPPRAAWLIAILVAFPANFFGSRWWAFRPGARPA